MGNDLKVPSHAEPSFIDEGNPNIPTASFTSFWGALGTFQNEHSVRAEGRRQFPLINYHTLQLIYQTVNDENLSFAG